MNDNWTNKPRSRREALQSMAGIGGLMAGGAMLSGCAPAKTSAPAENLQPVDFSDPRQSLRAFVKATADLDPTKETPGWFGGTIFGDDGPSGKSSRDVHRCGARRTARRCRDVRDRAGHAAHG